MIKFLWQDADVESDITAGKTPRHHNRGLERSVSRRTEMMNVPAGVRTRCLCSLIGESPKWDYNSQIVPYSNLLV